MNKIKKGDIVGRKSYGKDIIFIVERIIQNKNDKIAILKGLVERIEADSDVDDLEIIEKRKIGGSKWTIDWSLGFGIKYHLTLFKNCDRIIKRRRKWNMKLQENIGLPKKAF